ncbi:amino acid ABC transporter substrate-binding protein [Hydrogenophaga sp. ZJX-1]|uniref:amino acid ABC transporter substrate-binding protein n=1 Tax=Hydrogenophaga sp. ZJX-1 TaxID=3404778 RepID=UPI003B284525
MNPILRRSGRHLLTAWLLCASLAAGAADFVSSLHESPALSRMAQSGRIRVGYIPTPGTFAFQDAQGQTVGYSIDICKRVIDRLRLRLARPDLSPEFLPIQASDRIPMLKAGAIDLECGGNTNTLARQKDVDFSHTFFNTGLRLLARKTLRVGRVNDLARKRVAVTRGTTAETRFRKLQLEQGVQVVMVGSDAEGLKLLEEGAVDAYAQDDVLLYGLMALSKLKDELAVSGPFMTVEPYAFMLPKGDLALREVVDRSLLDLMHSGELLSIYRKWFDGERLRIPMSIYMKENIRFPNKYGIP